MPAIFRQMLLIIGLAFCCGAPAVAQQDAATTLRVVPHADLTILDSHFTGVYITRNFGYLVYDMLFAMYGQFRPQPEMG